MTDWFSQCTFITQGPVLGLLDTVASHFVLFRSLLFCRCYPCISFYIICTTLKSYQQVEPRFRPARGAMSLNHFCLGDCSPMVLVLVAFQHADLGPCILTDYGEEFRLGLGRI